MMSSIRLHAPEFGGGDLLVTMTEHPRVGSGAGTSGLLRNDMERMNRRWSTKYERTRRNMP